MKVDWERYEREQQEYRDTHKAYRAMFWIGFIIAGIWVAAFIFGRV